MVQFVRPTTEFSTPSGRSQEEIGGKAASGLSQEACEDGATTKQMKHMHGATRACPELQKAAAFLQKFIHDAGNESREARRDGFRLVIVTSTLEDWLHRGTHPVLASMSLQVYGMWVFRVERTPG